MNVVPKPFQSPHPPVRVAVQSMETFRLVGGMGYPIFIRLQMAVPRVRELIEEYQSARSESGFAGRGGVNLLMPVYVADTEAQALSEPEASAMRQRRAVSDLLATASSQENYDRLKLVSEASYDEVLKGAIFGTPEAVTERILELPDRTGTGRPIAGHEPGRPDPQRVGDQLHEPAD